MKCPYCGKEMEHGYIEGGASEMNWKLNKSKVFSTGNATPQNNAVVLAPLSVKALINRNCVEAFLCRDCKKIVIDCDNAEF